VWEINLTDQLVEWFFALGDVERRQITAAIDELEARGPALGRPFVDRIKGSRHHNMKELRSVGGNIRVLFAFDPSREAVLLIGGDKTGRWQRWYEENIPIADALYDEYLESNHEDDQVDRRSS
jgi:hypothetical protein